MKIILLSDIHLMNETPICRLDDFPATQCEKLTYIFDYAKNQGSCVVLQAGDVFDAPRSWHLLPKVIAFLKKYNLPVLSIYGQHDTYLYNEGTRPATNLGILGEIGLVKILSKKPYRLHNCTFYGASFGQEIPKPKNKAISILAIHAPIGEKEMFPGHKISTPKDILKKYNHDLILCGDIHRQFLISKDERIICNTGCISRKTAKEYNLEYEPMFYVYDSITGKIEKKIIPHKPSSEVITREHIETKQNLYDFSKFSDSIKNIKSDKLDVKERILEIFEKLRVKPEVKKILSTVMEIE
jgi:DNA repair protein SbcD/Mre11